MDMIRNIKLDKRDLLSLVIILAVLTVMFSKFLFQGLEPVGVDVIASIGATHEYIGYEKEHHETVLWNPNVFSGMPAYPRRIPGLIHVDTLINILGKITDWRFLYFLAGAFGLFAYLRWLKVDWTWALTAALALILLPHWQALIEVGHNTKLRAFMILPWFLFSFHYFFRSGSWISTGLFAFVFSWLVRTQHFQVVFYGILLLVFIFLVPYIRIMIEGKWSLAGSLLLKLIIALILTVFTAAQPFLTIREYTPYSTRGGNAVELDKTGAAETNKKGVDIGYATQWSLSPKEILSFAYPRLFGGYSTEIYDGDKFPQYRNKSIPGYWGEMPFTQSYDSIGMLMIFFAVLGLVSRWKDVHIRGIAAFIMFSVLLAFGRHFEWFYRLFFDYIPYFSKFRVPSMIINVTFISMLIPAAYGLQDFGALLKGSKQRSVLYGLSTAVLVSLLLYVFRGSFSLISAQEIAKYGLEQFSGFRAMRLEILEGELIRVGLISLAALILAGLYAFNRIDKLPFTAGIIILIMLELGSITYRANTHMNLQDGDRVEASLFRTTDVNRFLSKAEPGYRVFTLGNEFQSNYYAYYYPMVTGYSAIKMQVIEDIRSQSLLTGGAINWPVLNMLGAKYVVAPGRISGPGLKPILQDEQRKEILFQNDGAMPKVWFVDSVAVVDKAEDVLRVMNGPGFNPASVAYRFGDGGTSAKYDNSGTVTLKESTPDRLTFSVESSTPGYAVFSEVYYPFWYLELPDGTRESEQINYVLRGAELPAGTYTFDMVFRPESYRYSLVLVWIGNILVLALILVPLFLAYRKGLPAA